MAQMTDRGTIHYEKGDRVLVRMSGRRFVGEVTAYPGPMPNVTELSTGKVHILSHRLLEKIPNADEIDELKAQWEADPVWDIENTDGFEAYRAELEAYRLEKEQEWKGYVRQELEQKARELGLDIRYHIPLVEYINRLEGRIQRLEERLDGGP
jgi:hypothetical protein